jgi:hypothetical protein
MSIERGRRMDINRREFIKGIAVAGSVAILPKRVYTQQEMSCKIVLFGSDGLRIDYAQTLRLLGAPGLSSLHPPICSLSGGISDTQAGWAAIWCGMPSLFSRAGSNLTYGGMPRNMHVMKKLMEAYHDRDFFPVWITAKGKNIRGNQKKSPHWEVYKSIVLDGHPGIYHGDKHREDEEVYGLATVALGEAISHENFCCFIHFANPDNTGHKFNNYEEYMKSARAVDDYISRLMQMLPAETDIIYCSDHGFDFKHKGDAQNSHGYSPRGMLATNFGTKEYENVCQMSLGRLTYKLAGQDPNHAVYYRRRRIIAHNMYGTDLI